MKKNFADVAALAAALLSLAASAAMGQSPTTKPALPSGFVSTPGIPGGGGAYEELFRVCELDKSQLSKAADIEARRAASVKDKGKTIKEAQDAFGKALASKDKDAIAETAKKCTAVRMAVQQASAKAQTDILALLTAQQNAKWREYITLKTIKQRYCNVKFTNQQWDKIMDAYEKLAKDSSVRPDKIIDKLCVVINGILTPDQKARQIMAGQYATMNKVCHFTDEQIQKLVKIEDDRTKAFVELQDKAIPVRAQLDAAWQAAQASGDSDALAALQKQYSDLYKPHSELNQQFQDKVRDVLTDKQKAAWAEEIKNTGLGGGRSRVPSGDVPSPK